MEHARGRQLTHVPGLNQDPKLQAMEMFHFVDIRGEKNGMSHQSHHKINNVPQLPVPQADEPDTSLFKPNLGLKFPNPTKAFVSDGPTVPVQPRSPEADNGQNFLKKLCIEVRNDSNVKLVGIKETKDFVEKLPHVNLPDSGVILNEDYEPTGKCYSEEVHYIETEKLSKGSFGKADLCIDTNSGKCFVKKTIEKTKFNKSEILVPLNLNHENLTKIIGVIQRETEDRQLMIELMLEYGGKALNHYLVIDNNLLTQSVIWDLTRQGLQGLAHMDTYSMVHLDIKPENMVVQQIGSRLLLKITDFGSAKLPHEPIKFVGWTPEYMAPEMCKLFLQMRYVKEGLTFGITEADITGKVDVNAFGLVVMYMYKRYHLLQKWIASTQGEATYKNIEANTRILLQQQLMIQVAGEPDIIKNLIPDECDLDMRDLLGRMTCHNHQNRLCAKDALLVIEDRERKMNLALQQNQAKLFIKEEEVEQVINWEAMAAFNETDNLPVSKIIEDNPERGPIKSSTKDRLRQKLKPYDDSGKMLCGKPSKGGKVTERRQHEKRLYSKCLNQPAPVAIGTVTGRHNKVMMEPMTPVDEMQSLSIKFSSSQMSEKYNTPVTQPQDSDMDVNEGVTQRNLRLPVIGLNFQHFETARQEGKTFSLHQGRVEQRKPTPALVFNAPQKLQLTPELKQAFLRKYQATSFTPAIPNVMASTPSIPVQPTETSKTFGAVAMDTGIFQNVSPRRRRVVQPKSVMQVEQEQELLMPDADIAGNMPRFDFL